MFKQCNKFFQDMKQQGQALVFLAISAPLLFTFIGAAADFGWLYFNQARLQNAADAAVIAGAQQLINRDSLLEDYEFAGLVSNFDDGLAEMIETKTISKRNTEYGDNMAKKYAQLTLDSRPIKDIQNADESTKVEIVDISPARGSNVVTDTTPDEWGKVKFSRILYGTDVEDYDTLYYTVTLSEQLNHFLPIMDYFDFIKFNAKAVAVAKITHYSLKEAEPTDNTIFPHGLSIYAQMRTLEQKKTFANWWQIKYGYDAVTKEDRKRLYGTDDTMTIARMRSVQAKGNEYVIGGDRNGNINYYRTETLTLSGWSAASTGNGNIRSGSQKDQRNFDSLFIDLKADVSNSNFKDQETGSTQNTQYNLKYVSSTDNNKSITATETFSNGLSGSDIFKFRIHDLINIGKYNSSTGKYEYVYKVREDRDAPDPLYIYIENEDNYVDGTAANSVRQMIINVNAANTSADDRPMFFFYDGPQKYDDKGKKQNTWSEKWRESWKYLGYENSDYINNNRNSLPVIFNMYANFRGVLFFPNSPLVINGNGYNFEGFIVAQKFLQLKRATDFPEKAQNPPSGYYLYKDPKGNEYYKNDDDIVYYHKAAQGGTRYIQIITGKNRSNQKVIRYRNVIYADATHSDITVASKNPVDDDITLADNIYMTNDGQYVHIPKNSASILYTYTWMNEEKSNMLDVFKDYEKDYVRIYPMYIDKMGNVQYKYLTGDYKYDERPVSNDTAWHTNWNPNNLGYSKVDDDHEIIYKPSAFKLGTVKYNSYNKIRLVNYTHLGGTLQDIFFTTIRSSWVD